MSRDDEISALKAALTAERARAEEYKRLMLKVSEDCVEFEGRAEAMEKERDELKLKLSHAEPEALACDHWVDMFAKANARADKAEAEVAALKARVAKVLEPFAREGRIIAETQILPPESGSPKAVFMAAAELHASLTGKDGGARTQAEGEGS